MPALTIRPSMTIVDASVVTAWFAKTETSFQARAFIRHPSLSAPEFLRIELTSSLLKRVRAGMLPPAAPAEAVASLDRLVHHFHDDGRLLAPATELALRHNHKIYDCLYLALCLDRQEPLATADRRMADVARALSIQTELIGPSL